MHHASSLFLSVAFGALSLAALPLGCTTTSTVTPDGGAPDAASTNPTDGGVAGDVGGDLGECVTYSPASISGTKTGSFTSADVVKITLPATDVGGGLLEVTYTQEASVTALLYLGEGSNAATPRIETSAFGPGVTSAAPAVVTYRLAGNKVYELGVKPFVFDATKAAYTVTYAYRALADCYEPNNTLAVAKRVPLNTMITAYHHTGIDTEDTGLVNESGDDWFRFTLDASQTVRLRGTLPGKDGASGGNSALFAVYQADGTSTVTAPRAARWERTRSRTPKPSRRVRPSSRRARTT